MPSPGDSVRYPLERGLRLTAWGALAAMLVAALATPSGGGTDRADSAALRKALVRWSTAMRPDEIALQLKGPPGLAERDWLRALVADGTRLSWSGDSMLPLAVQLEPRADPAGGTDLTVAAGQGAPVIIADSNSVLDTLGAGPGLAVLGSEASRPALEAASGSVRARAVQTDSLSLGRILLMGRAGWEFKFTAAALEERGWQVDARALVSPRSAITQSVGAPIDTGRYAAVVVLDSSAARSVNAIVAYVRDGGGLVLWPEAVRLRALAALSPARFGTLIRSDHGAINDSMPREGLDLFPLVQLDPTSVVLERRGSEVGVAARRLGAGRVILVGYQDLWRWRMAGSDSALARHRAWLSALVARVAFADATILQHRPSNVAPLASLLDALGPAAPGRLASHFSWETLLSWLCVVALIALLGEWLSRRLRGAR